MKTRKSRLKSFFAMLLVVSMVCQQSSLTVLATDDTYVEDEIVTPTPSGSEAEEYTEEKTEPEAEESEEPVAEEPEEPQVETEKVEAKLREAEELLAKIQDPIIKSNAKETLTGLKNNLLFGAQDNNTIMAEAEKLLALLKESK